MAVSQQLEDHIKKSLSNHEGLQLLHLVNDYGLDKAINYLGYTLASASDADRIIMARHRRTLLEFNDHTCDDEHVLGAMLKHRYISHIKISEGKKQDPGSSMFQSSVIRNKLAGKINGELVDLLIDKCSKHGFGNVFCNLEEMFPEMDETDRILVESTFEELSFDAARSVISESKRKSLKPHEGGCWFCKKDKTDSFSAEFDTNLHMQCLRDAYQEHGEKDHEAAIMMRELCPTMKEFLDTPDSEARPEGAPREGHEQLKGLWAFLIREKEFSDGACTDVFKQINEKGIAQTILDYSHRNDPGGKEKHNALLEFLSRYDKPLIEYLQEFFSFNDEAATAICRFVFTQGIDQAIRHYETSGGPNDNVKAGALSSWREISKKALAKDGSLPTTYTYRFMSKLDEKCGRDREGTSHLRLLWKTLGTTIIEQHLTETAFNNWREKLRSYGILLEFITRVPYQEPETIE